MTEMTETQAEAEIADLKLLFRGYGVSKADMTLRAPPGCVIHYFPAGGPEWRILGKGQDLPAGSRVKLVPTSEVVTGDRATRRKKMRAIHKAMRSKR